ncbi:TetR/AcrR family transcriptional regulator [Nannocystis sp. ILAH1]|uniref:TetR/AcrR family transcriptional regulator n=1 Tax=unclassified Nannocystis TaxID=2627009 RepID=UPI00226D8CBF|nr:TetR/AcrR family transcriptional regulator [Nannocystis sp. ILAH1]MCY1064794.1 TetR/AcrR family transcriptional regulator [Nannocystis sp. RBIL2]
MPATARKKPAKRRRSPIQSRGQATVDAIVEAAAQILARKGPAAATTNAVAARAGVSIGTLYQYFADREALLQEIGRRHVAEMQAVLAAALTGIDGLALPAAVDRLVAAIVAMHRVAPRLHQALHQSLARDHLDTIDAFEVAVEAMVSHALASRDELDLAHPALTATVLVRGLGGLIRTTLRREPERLDDPALALAMRAMILGTLGESRRRT